MDRGTQLGAGRDAQRNSIGIRLGLVPIVAVMTIGWSCSGGGGGDTAVALSGLTLSTPATLQIAVDSGGSLDLAAYSYVVSNDNSMDALPFTASSDSAWLTVTGGASGQLSVGQSAAIDLAFDEGMLTGLGQGTYIGTLELCDGNDPDRLLGSRRIRASVANPTGPSSGRVTAGLVVLYDFEEASGNVVNDTSGVGSPMDLQIETPGTVIWQPGALHLDGEARIATSGPGTKVFNACTAFDEVTLEAWLTPTTVNQSGPARIATLSGSGTARNVTLGHGLWADLPDTAYNVRLRTTDGGNDDNGSPDLRTSAGAVQSGLQHVVYTRAAGGDATIYVDGVAAATGVEPGDFSNWDSSFRFALGNELGDSRPWYGSMHLVALYDRALTSGEVTQNFSEGTGDAQAGFLVVTPSSDFSSYGVVGGGLSSETKEYELSNPGTIAVAWSVAFSESWISTDGPSSGLLAPGGQQTVTLQLDAAHFSSQPAGSYNATASWVNNTSGFGSTDLAASVTMYESGGGGGQKPGPHNTGPSNPAILVPSGSIVASTDGQIIENVEVSGRITIAANNVTIRNFRVNGGGTSYGIHAQFNYTGTLIEDGEIFDVGSACIFGKGFTARRLNMHESKGDGMKARGDVLVEACWIHHLGTAPGAHADGDQTRVGDNLVFRGNNFDMPIPESPNGEQGYKSNANFIIQDSLGTIDNLVIEENWLNGGNYTLFFTPNNPGGITNVLILNNRFGRDYRYGVLLAGGTPMVISGNVWDDTGQSMSINNQ